MERTYIDTRYLEALTDDFGVWQHSNLEAIEISHGYALDDSARGMIAALLYEKLEIAESCLGFMERACQVEGIANFYDGTRKPVNHPFSEDALGEVIWALGYCIEYGYEVNRAQNLIDLIDPYIKAFAYSRARAYAILGYLKCDPERAHILATILYSDYLEHSSAEWPWPEPYLVYGNAILPLALLTAGQQLNESKWVDAGARMLDFLNKETKHEGLPIAIGNDGWYFQGKEKALFDQQPIDPAYQVLANCAAWQATALPRFNEEATLYIDWFWGLNCALAPLIEPVSGVCFDGLGKEGISTNKGAENIICYLIAQSVYQSTYDC
jgi:hypothetical protein